MDKPTPKERAEHILEAIKLIKRFVAGMDETAFSNDIKIQSAVQYQFLIIGEAIRHIDDAILTKYTYPWHIPRSFRNFIIHVYHGVKMERIYFAAQDLDELEKLIILILKKEFK
ncbi:HepT-like ribonuclease domain-containing protein [Agriterribacter humi]|uniref:HepT-like ribonuclease domain-containing protein n=1 Tax=Agriterribacter humi TaxID=1104781 RepID=UPI001264DEAD|nr:HepT-like ribonuclease domain-containing protein [Agriterribacter humi]